MSSEQFVVEKEPIDKPGRDSRATARPEPRRSGMGAGAVVLFLLVAAGVGGGYYFLHAGGKSHSGSEPTRQSAGAEPKSLAGVRRPTVEVTSPKRGGMEMTTRQPGTVRAFEYAELYAKVSGYVKDLKVDRGSRVKKGDLLISIYAPELEAAVEQARAALVRASASVKQAEARVATAEETIKAKIAHQEETVAVLHAATAQREYREKAFKRISDLVARKAVEERLRDEEEDRQEAARASEYAAKSGVETAKAQVAEARAFLSQAKADLDGALADVSVAKANLDEKTTWESYTQIRSPYEGVVISRGEAVHPGAFVQSAEKGMTEPMLIVARDDTMRTVIPVPDRDVPYCDLGDPAVVKVDALNDREFKGVVSRIAESEDVNDRTMRVEVDLPNPQRVLRDGMFGRAEIILQKSTPHLTVPSTAVLDRDSEGKGAVQVVRDGKLYHQPVVIGRDNGTIAEIVQGLDESAMVVIKPDVALTDGTEVQTETSQPAEPDGKRPPAHA